MNWTSGASSLLALMLAGCGAVPASGPMEPEIVVKTRTIDTSCQSFKPVYLDKGDILADETAKQINANNEMGAKKCGWKPPGK